MIPEYIHSQATIMVCSPVNQTRWIEHGLPGLKPEFIRARIGDIESIIAHYHGTVVTQRQYEPPVIAVWLVNGVVPDIRACDAAVEIRNLYRDKIASIDTAVQQFFHARVGIASGECILQKEGKRYSYVFGEAMARASNLHDHTDARAAILLDEKFAKVCSQYELKGAADSSSLMLGPFRGES